MKITVKGRNIDITPAINEFVQDKFIKKLDRQSEGVKEIQVTLSVAKPESKAEAVIEVVGDTFHTEASVTDGDVYAAVDLLLDKVTRVIIKHKEKTQNC